VAWFVRHRLVLVTGLAASLPVIVSTVNAMSNGWLPLGDDAITAVRSFDVLSTHPPLLGPISSSGMLIGHAVQSPGPMLFWLLAIPVRLGPLGPAVWMGVVNVCCVIGIVALARRRGGLPLMFAGGAAVAAMCGSLDSHLWHDLWGPAVTLLPFTLLFFLAWSVACGEYRLLPLTALVASFTIQAHLTYILPVAAILTVAVVFLVVSKQKIPRRWLWGTLAVVAVCWCLPLAEEAVHRPGNVERIVEAATAVKQSYGASGGARTVVRAVGATPGWLEGPRTPFGRVAEVIQDPLPFAIATAVLVLVLLGGLAVAALRSGRRDVAAAAVLALALMVSLFAVVANSPSGNPLFATISYTTWWASPAGMFAWIVLGFGAVTLLSRGRRPAGRFAGASAVAGIAAVAAVGAVVAAGQNRDRLETMFRSARSIADRVRADAPRDATLLVTGDTSEIGIAMQSAVAFAMRDEGLRFVNSSLLGLGTRYDPDSRPHDMVMTVTEHPTPGAPVFARQLLVNVPADGPPSRRTFYVTLAPR
jgi:hypothetical protein